MSTAFFVSGIPKGQPRPRAFAFHGKARVFDPGTAEGWKSCIAARAHEFEGFFKTGPLYVSIDFTFPRPKSHSNRHGVRDDAPVYHIAKPDSDNAAKAVLDALTQIGVWSDDAQVAELRVSKRYGDRPGAFIAIEDLGEDEP